VTWEVGYHRNCMFEQNLYVQSLAATNILLEHAEWLYNWYHPRYRCFPVGR